MNAAAGAHEENLGIAAGDAGSRSIAESAEIEIGERAFRAVLIDLDGTLLTTAGAVTPRTIEVIHAVQRLGVRVMIVTGRSVPSARAAVANLRLETPISCFNGGAIYCTQSEKLLDLKLLEPTLCRRLMIEIEALGFDCFASCGDQKLTLAPRQEEYERLLSTLAGVVVVDDLSQIPAASIARLTVYGPAVQVEALRAAMAARLGKQVYMESFPMYSLPSHRDFGGAICDIHPPSDGKAEALFYLEERYRIPREDVIAIGDGLNDLSMLQRVGMAVATAGAFDEVKAIAAQVIGHHDDDAVAAFLSATFLGLGFAAKESSCHANP